jgi:hypothetical protein
MKDHVAAFRHHAATLPQPVAYGMGRIARASNAHQQFDAALRAAESLTRYVAVLALSSFAARSDQSVHLASNADAPGKALAWGDFLNLARAVAGSAAEHPLSSRFAAGLGTKKSQRSGGGPSSGLDLLTRLAELRNRTLGHSLLGNNSEKADAFLREENVCETLLAAVDTFQPVLRLPLMVVESQSRQRGRLRARVVPYTGESEPYPRELEVTDFVDEREPLLVVGRDVLCLSPGLIWEVHRSTRQSTLFFLDRVGEETLVYRPYLHDETATRPTDPLEPMAWLSGQPRPKRPFTAPDGSGHEPSLRVPSADVVGGQTSDKRTGEPSSDPASVAGTSIHGSKDKGASGEKADAAVEPLRVEPGLATRANDDPPFRHRSIEEIAAEATERGLGEQFASILEATERCGLHNRPYRHGVMSTPPEHKNRYLIWTSIDARRTPGLKVSFEATAFEEFYPITATRVVEIVGPARRFEPGSSVSDLVEGIDRLSAEIRRTNKNRKP